jgi:hypothetical protein
VLEELLEPAGYRLDRATKPVGYRRPKRSSAERTEGAVQKHGVPCDDCPLHDVRSWCARTRSSTAFGMVVSKSSSFAQSGSMVILAICA